MLNVRYARMTFHITDILGAIGVAVGIAFLIAGFASPRGMQGMFGFGAAMVGSGLTCFIVSHIGRATVEIAETNREILAHLRK